MKESKGLRLYPLDQDFTTLTLDFGLNNSFLGGGGEVDAVLCTLDV
jgi:hypothetical protein